MMAHASIPGLPTLTRRKRVGDSQRRLEAGGWFAGRTHRPARARPWLRGRGLLRRACILAQRQWGLGSSLSALTRL